MPKLKDLIADKPGVSIPPDVNTLPRFDPSAITDPQSISLADYSKQVVSTAGQTGTSIAEAERLVEEQTWKQAVFGGLAKGGLQAAKALSNYPAHVLHVLDVASRKTVEKASAQPTGMIWMPKRERDRLLASKSFWGIAEEEVAPLSKWIEGGINDIIKTHPEWQGKPPENVIDLLTSPKKLVNTITQSIPVLIAAGLATATGHPVAAYSIMYAVEGQEAKDAAIAFGTTEEEAEKAQVLYGSVAAAIEYAQIHRGLKLLKGMRGAILTRSAQKVAHTGQRTITKQLLLTAIEESAEEMAQGTWEEQVAKRVYGKEPEGGLLGFVDRRAQEAVVATALTAITGVGGAVSTVAGKGKAVKAEPAFEVSEEERKAEALRRQEKGLLPEVREDEFEAEPTVQPPKLEISPVAVKEGVLGKTISRHHNNLRIFLKDVKGDFAAKNRITYGELAEVISKDKSLTVNIKETPIDPSKPLGETTKSYVVKLDGKELRPIPKEVYDLIEALTPAVEGEMATGKPVKMELYRGIKAKPKGVTFATDAGDLGAGAYWTNYQPTARVYGKGGEVLTETKSFKNPLVLSAEEAVKLSEKYKTVEAPTMEERLIGAKRMSEDLRKQGYDALIVEGYDVPKGYLTIVDLAPTPAEPAIEEPAEAIEAIEPEVAAVSEIPKEGQKGKERKFITSVKEEFPDLVTRVSGEYIPRSTDKLSIKASNLIKDDINVAENLAKTKSTDKAVATASELIKHYVGKSQEAISEADKGIFLDKAAEVAHASAARLTELGRAVQAASILTRLTPEGQLRFAAKIINDYNNKVEGIRGGLLGLRRKIPQLTKEEAAEIIAEAKRIENMVDGTAKAEAFWNLQQKIYDLIPAPLYRKMINLWKAGLLTGLKTHGLNVLSNLSHGVSESVKEYPAEVVDRMSSLVTHKRTIAARTGTTGKGIVDGAERGWHYVKTGFDTRNVSAKLDWRRVSFGTSKFARWFQAYEQTVFRLMGAGDQPFYYGAKAKSVYSQAVAQAIDKDLHGKDRAEFVKGLIDGPSDEMLRYAVIDAETAVFINRTVLGDLARAFQKVPGGEVIVPFARTPAAIATQIVNYSPVGAVKTLVQNIGKGRFDQRLFSQGMGRAITGTGVLFIGTILFKAGMIATALPDNERERELWKLEGKKPNSIKIGGKWRTPETLGPAGNVVLIGGYFAEALNAEGSPSKAIGTAVSGAGRVFAEQTFIRSVNQAAEAMLDADRSAEQFFAQLAGSVVPTLVADYARAIDSKERRAEGPLGRLKTRVPFVREKEEPRVNVFGQDLPRYGGNPLETMIDPTRPAIIHQDKLVDELRRLWDKNVKVSPTLLGDKKGYASLTPKQNTALWQRAGQRIYHDLSMLFDRYTYEIASNKKKGKMIETIVEDVKNSAKAEAIKETINSLGDLDKLKEHRESGLLTEDVATLLRLTKQTMDSIQED